jgi:DNA polymerase-3 subunit alpha
MINVDISNVWGRQSLRDLLAMEKEMLGVYITGHPLNDYADRIRELTSVTSEDLASAAEPEHNADHHIQDGMTVIMAGMITGQKKLVTKNNKMMSFVDLEDLYGTVEVVVFPNVYDKFSHALTEDNVVVIKGKLNFKEEEVPKLLADTIVEIHAVEENMDLLKAEEDRGYSRGGRGNNYGGQQVARTQAPRPQAVAQDAVKVRIPADGDEKQILQDLQLIFRAFPGSTQVLIYLQSGKIVGTGAQGGVQPTIEFFDTVADLVGRPNIKGKPVF